MQPLRHGSDLIVISPDSIHSRKDKDFGSGFYTTNNLNMAAKWAVTKMKVHGKNVGYVNEYSAPEFPKDFKILRFNRMDEKWLDFVHKNRTRLSFEHDYDIVIGPTADLEIADIMFEYDRGWLTKKETLEMLRKHQVGTQILFHTERATRLLKFKYKQIVDIYGNITADNGKRTQIKW